MFWVDMLTISTRLFVCPNESDQKWSQKRPNRESRFLCCAVTVCENGWDYTKKVTCHPLIKLSWTCEPMQLVICVKIAKKYFSAGSTERIFQNERKLVSCLCLYSSDRIAMSFWLFSQLHLIIMSLWHHSYDPSHSYFACRIFIFDYTACHLTPMLLGHSPSSFVTNTHRIWFLTSVPYSGHMYTHSIKFLQQSHHYSCFHPVTHNVPTLPPASPLTWSCADLVCKNYWSVCLTHVSHSFPTSISTFY